MTLKELDQNDQTLELTVQQINDLWSDAADIVAYEKMPVIKVQKAQLWTYNGKTHLIVIKPK